MTYTFPLFGKRPNRYPSLSGNKQRVAHDDRIPGFKRVLVSIQPFDHPLERKLDVYIGAFGVVFLLYLSCAFGPLGRSMHYLYTSKADEMNAPGEKQPRYWYGMPLQREEGLVSETVRLLLPKHLRHVLRISCIFSMRYKHVLV